jgi:hypothetical protein
VIGRTAYTESLTGIKGGGDLEKYLGVSALKAFINIDMLLEGMEAFSPQPNASLWKFKLHHYPKPMHIDNCAGWVHASSPDVEAFFKAPRPYPSPSQDYGLLGPTDSVARSPKPQGRIFRPGRRENENPQTHVRYCADIVCATAVTVYLLHFGESKSNLKQRELEADATSFVVASHFGLNPRSKFYLAAYGVKASDLLESLPVIQTTAAQIISARATNAQHETAAPRASIYLASRSLWSKPSGR